MENAINDPGELNVRGEFCSSIIKGFELTFERQENYGEEISSACC